jgi:hypothetical protein
VTELNVSGVVRLGQLVRFDGTGWVCAKRTPMLSICVIYIYSVYIYNNNNM